MENNKGGKASLAIPVMAILALIGVQVTLYLAYFYAPTQINRGTLWVVTPNAAGAPINLYESYRILFIHVPAALSTALCCLLTLVGGVMWLLTKKPGWDSLTVAASEVGLLACGAVLISGTLWGDYAWGSGRLGSGWNWEPRLTTTLILWLAFAALLVLRRAMDQPQLRLKVTAIYGILLSPLYPLVSKAIEIGQTSHPTSFKDQMSAPEIATVNQVARFSVILVFVALVALRVLMNNVAKETDRERAA